jgi:ribosomal protein S27E
MECPECKNETEQLCMYGNNEEINIDHYCKQCGTLVTLTWKPGKRAKKQETLE